GAELPDAVGRGNADGKRLVEKRPRQIGNRGGRVGTDLAEGTRGSGAGLVALVLKAFTQGRDCGPGGLADAAQGRRGDGADQRIAVLERRGEVRNCGPGVGADPAKGDDAELPHAVP